MSESIIIKQSIDEDIPNDCDEDFADVEPTENRKFARRFREEVGL